jgi:hypothetical protein
MALILLTKQEIRSLTFPDSDVLEFSLDLPARFLSVRCSDGYLDAKEGGRVICGVELQIIGFDSLQIREFANEKMTSVDKYSDVFALKDICEFTGDHDGTTLKGFSKLRRFWTEYFFSGGDLSGFHKS